MPFGQTVLDTRQMSGFPVSIGTGLALETIFTPIRDVIDEARIPPDRPDLSLYSDYIINMSTILRNLLSSVAFKDLQTVPLSAISDVFLGEVEFLTNFFNMNGMNVNFYVHTYDYVKKTYPTKLRLAKSDQQKYLQNIVDYCLDKVKKENDVKHFNKTISYQPDTSALIITHVPWDLLSYDKFRRLDLLESHTGIVKSRKDWNTKYFKIPEKDMSFLPFMEYLLTVFGDNVMFSPDPLKDRLDLYESLVKKKVHPLMSEMTLSFIR